LFDGPGKGLESSEMDIVKIISLAGLLVIFSKIYLSIKRNKYKPKRHAAEKLFEAFIDEIQDLSIGKGDAYEILKQAFPKHEMAYIKFRPHLRGKVLRQFDEAWRDYCCRNQENPQAFLEQYFAPGNETMAKEKRLLALKRILKIISFARKSFVLKVRDNAALTIAPQPKG